MRLFIAINFEEEIKSKINEIIDKIKGYAVQGRFVKKEHMHLTLEFLGEVPKERLDDIKSVMDIINSSPFKLSLTGLGYFRRKEGNIYWLGVKDNKALMDLQSRLHNLLLAKGYELENREYKPHVTIGRRVCLEDTLNENELMKTISDIIIKVNSIDLMKSKISNGKLMHELIYSKKIL